MNAHSSHTYTILCISEWFEIHHSPILFIMSPRFSITVDIFLCFSLLFVESRMLIMTNKCINYWCNIWMSWIYLCTTTFPQYFNMRKCMCNNYKGKKITTIFRLPKIMICIFFILKVCFLVLYTHFMLQTLFIVCNWVKNPFFQFLFLSKFPCVLF